MIFSLIYLNNSKLISITATFGILTCIIFSIFIRKDENYPILIWWTPFIIENRKVISCSNGFRCLITKDRHHRSISNFDAYLFYGSHLQYHDLPLPRNHSLWAIFHEESPRNLASFLDSRTQSLFNITATFSRHSSLPLTLQYLDDINNLTDNEYYIDVELKNEYLKELAPILYIQSNCDTPVQRDKVVEELMNYIKIDSYGLCINNKKLPDKLADVDPSDYYNKNLIRLAAKYKFTLAIENAICEDYITEKIWRPLIAGSIPIYLGSPSIEHFLPNNHSAILIKDYVNFETLAAYIETVNQKDDLYKSYMKHKLQKTIDNPTLINSMKTKQLNTDQFTEFECLVCEEIHKQNFERLTRKNSVYECPMPEGDEKENPWVSHWKIGKCQSKVLRNFVEIGQNFTKDEFDKAWLALYEKEQC